VEILKASLILIPKTATTPKKLKCFICALKHLDARNS